MREHYHLAQSLDFVNHTLFLQEGDWGQSSKKSYVL